jgi:AraC family transcriptional regulator
VYIYGSWFPKSGYKVSGSPDIEWYDNRFLGPDNENSEVEIYIPIENL